MPRIMLAIAIMLLGLLITGGCRSRVAESEPATSTPQPEVSESPAVSASAAPEPVAAVEPVAAPEPAAPIVAERVVYLTETGTRYHKSDCRHVRGTKIETTLAAAKAKGYEPCGTCNPPKE